MDAFRLAKDAKFVHVEKKIPSDIAYNEVWSNQTSLYAMSEGIFSHIVASIFLHGEAKL